MHLSTGFGGGKTYALAQKLIQLSWLNRDISGGCMAINFKEVKKDLLPIFEDILDRNNIQYRYHKTEMWFLFPWSRGKLYIFSAENPLRGPNLGYFGFNEVTLMTPQNYQEGIGRVRVKGASHPQIVSVGTPEGVGNFMYERFVDKAMPNSRIIYGDTRDNQENLSADYITSLENSYDKIMLDAYLRGLWINMNGNQFYYSFDPKKNEDDRIEWAEEQPVLCALDFNVEHMTATLWHFDGYRLEGFDEIVIDNDADTQKMARALYERGYTPLNTVIYPDPAGSARNTKGQPDHVILRNAGYEVVARSAAPRMRARQLNVNNLLDKQRIKYNPKKMPTLRRDFQAVEQDKGTLDKIKSNPKLTHASDGVDYMCDILFPLSGKKPKSDIIKVR